MNDEARFLRLPDVKRRVGVGRTTIYRWINANMFPAPVRIGPLATAWLASDIDRWIADRVRASARRAA